MLIAGFDAETTGLNVHEDHITQAAVVLWDTESKKKKAKVKFSAYLKGPHMPELSPEIVELTGITNADLDKYGYAARHVMRMVNSYFSQADAICAHNGGLFDKPLYLANCVRHGVESVDKLWIDTSCDIEYPAHISTRKLVYLATDHGFMNPFPHDAESDVMTMLNIADRYDWAKTLEYAKAPTLVVIAQLSFHQKEERERAKKLNYRWNPDAKIWTKSIKDFQFQDETRAAKEAGFLILVKKG